MNNPDNVKRFIQSEYSDEYNADHGLGKIMVQIDEIHDAMMLVNQNQKRAHEKIKQIRLALNKIIKNQTDVKEKVEVLEGTLSSHREAVDALIAPDNRKSKKLQKICKDILLSNKRTLDVANSLILDINKI